MMNNPSDISSIRLPFESLTLKNGLTVWLSYDDSQPKVYGSVIVHIGAKDSPNTGIAHYFEHIMFKGTDKIGTIDYASEKPILDKIEEKYLELKEAKDEARRAEIQKEINQLSIQAAEYAVPNDFNNLISKYGGTELNAATSFDYTFYHSAFTPEYLRHWCMMNSERFLSPVFRLFQSELETVYEEKNMYSDQPITGVQEALFQRLASPHPYRYPIIGSTEALKSPDLHAMQEFFDKYYSAGNMGLILTGDFERKGIEQLLDETFGRLKPGKAERPVAELPKPMSGESKLDVLLPIPMVKGTGIVWRGVPLADKRLIHMQVIQGLLTNEGKTGLLDVLILEHKLQMAQAAPFSLNDMGFFLTIQLPKLPFQSNKSAKNMVLKAISRIRKGDISQMLFEQVKVSLHKQLIQQLEDPKKRHELLQNVMAQGSSIDRLEDDLKTLQQMTIADVQEVAKEFLGNDRLVVTKKNGRYPSDKIQKPAIAPVIAKHTHAVSPFAKELEAIPITPLPIRTQDLSGDHLFSYINDNPLVKYFHTKNEYNSLFSLEMIFFRGSYDHPIVEVLENYMELVGTRDISAREFNQSIQVLGSTLTFTASRSYFMVSMQGYDHHFEESVQLLVKVLTETAQDKNVLKQLLQLKKTSDNALKSSTQEISARFSDFIRYGERADYRRSLTYGQMKKLKPSDLVNELKSVLSTEVDIHYCGTLPEDSVKDVLRRLLPLSDVKYTFPGYTFIESDVQKVSQRFVAYQKDSSQSIIKGYIQLGHLTPEEEKVATLFDTYFGSGMGSVLFQEVREYRSLAYGVSAQMVIPHRNSPAKVSDMTISMSTQSDKTEEALSLIEELIANPPFTSERLNSASNGLRSIASSLYPTMRMRSRRLSSMLRQGLSEDIAVELLQAANEVTLEELREFHRKHISGKNITFTILGDIESMNLTKGDTEVSISDILHL